MRRRLDKLPSSTEALRAEVEVWGGRCWEGEGGIGASNVIILINLCHSRQSCVITAPDSRSPGAAAQYGEGGGGVGGGHKIPVAAGENFPTALSMINYLCFHSAHSCFTPVAPGRSQTA